MDVKCVDYESSSALECGVERMITAGWAVQRIATLPEDHHLVEFVRREDDAREGPSEGNEDDR